MYVKSFTMPSGADPAGAADEVAIQYHPVPPGANASAPETFTPDPEAA